MIWFYEKNLRLIFLPYFYSQNNQDEPQLRFPEFNEPWKRSKLEDICNIQDGTHSTPNYTDEGIPFFSVETITSNADPKFISAKEHEKLIKRCQPKKGDILLTRIGTLAKSKIVDWDYDFSIYVSLALLNSIKIDSEFLNQYLNTPNYQKDFLSKSLLLAVPQKINLKDLKETKINYPSFEEQKKISLFLKNIDKKIELLEKKKNFYKDYKRYLVQNLTEYKGQETWKKYKIKELLKEYSEKSTINNQFPVLSSTKEGIKAQLEYFNRNIASSDNVGYKIIHRNQLVLSPQNLWLGNININDEYDVGLVSPSYKIYDLTDIIDINYLKNIIKTTKMLYLYKTVSEQGASVVRRNLNKELFENIEIFLPSKSEQEKIGFFLKNVDNKIEYINNNKLELELFKKGLLQKMFV